MIADRFTDGFDPEIVKAWIADDPNPVTAAALQKQLDAARANLAKLPTAQSPTSPKASRASCSSARPACAAKSGPAPAA